MFKSISVIKAAIVTLLYITSPNPINITNSGNINISLINTALACDFVTSTNHDVLICPPYQGPWQTSYRVDYWDGNAGGRGVWEQGEDWADDRARTDLEKARAEIGYDIRTGHIDATEACELSAMTDRNFCRSGHRTAAVIVGGACILTGTVATSGLGAAAAVAVCEGAVAVHLDNQLDVCELEYTARKAMCN